MGRSVTSTDFSKLIKSYGIVHQRTPKYSPQCNPVERLNRTLKVMIACYVNENHRKWDVNLPEFQFALNTAHHETTKFTPANLNFQRDIFPPNTLRNTLEDHTRQLIPEADPLKETLELVRVNLANAYTQQSKHYDKGRRDWTPQRGEVVSSREHFLSSAADNFAAKLAPSFKGNCIVIDVLGKTRVKIRDEDGKTHVCHVKDLKPFHPAEKNYPMQRRIEEEETNHQPVHESNAVPEENSRPYQKKLRSYAAKTKARAPNVITGHSVSKFHP